MAKASLSIVVPAHDEAAVIERCLSSLLADATVDEFEVVVVCNGCADDTAERARRFAPAVQVLELAEAGKVQALRVGEAALRALPRLFVDADVVLTTRAARTVAAALRAPGGPVVAAPRALAVLGGRPWAVRAFYRVWTSLPFFGPGFVGAGVYGLSAAARERFAEFPDLIADDGFARLIARPDERATVEGASFEFHPPHRLSAVLQVMTRIRAGRLQLRRTMPELLANETTAPQRSLRFLLRRPSLWLASLVYLPVMLLAELRARLQLRAGAVPWQQDRSSRVTTSNATEGDA